MKPAPLHQRGASTLAFSLILVGAVILAVTFANRSLVFEQRSASNHQQSVQAFEAAEAGLGWALAQLNNDTPVDDACQPASTATAKPGARSFRERFLRIAADGRWVVRDDAPAPACRQTSQGWVCHCTNTPADQVDTHGIAFTTTLAESGQGLLSVSARGQSQGVETRSQVLLGLLPGLASEPAAALTVRGMLSLGTSAFDLQHLNPGSGGITLHTGGETRAPALRVVSAPGVPASASRREQDALLAALTPDGLFASVFRMGRADWRDRPAVQTVNCHQPCGGALSEAARRHQLIWLDGGLPLEGDLDLGTPERPVVLVIDGPARLQGRLRLQGLVYLTGDRWDDHAGAQINGALVAEGDLQATGNTQIRHDTAVLQALQQRSGSFARVAGSWRDF